MNRWFRTLMLAALLLGCWASISRAEEAAPVVTSDAFNQLLTKYCADCHNADDSEGNLRVDQFKSVDDIFADRATWKKVHKQLRSGGMPPAGSDRPDDATRDAVSVWLDAQLNTIDFSKPIDPGHVTVRRLNRSEYDNTIRDLFGMSLQLSFQFPADDAGYGFDNIGDVLTISPLHLDNYLDAAESVTRELRRLEGNNHNYGYYHLDIGYDGARQRVGDRYSLVATGTVGFIDSNIPLPGEYTIGAKVEVRPSFADTKLDRFRRGERPRVAERRDPPADEKAEIQRLNGRTKAKIFWDGEEIAAQVLKADSDPGKVETYHIEARVNVKPGKHDLRFAHVLGHEFEEFREDTGYLLSREAHQVGLVTMYVRRERGIAEETMPPAALAYLKATGRSDEPAKSRVETYLKNALPRAFRRDLSAEELARWNGFGQSLLDDGLDMQGVVDRLTQAMLVAPEFLFRKELLTDRQSDETIQPLDSWAMASRLSYFLWNSMPDDELLALAREGRLTDEAVLRAQTQRMLKDPKSQAFIDSFFGQWLGLRKLDGVQVDSRTFPKFSSKMKIQMKQETENFVTSIVREDRSLQELLTAKYTFINDDLARLYGIDGVEGGLFKRVDLADVPRSGLLTHASVLTLSSYPTRTSPPKRGSWVLENILGDKPPDPPPGVSALDSTQQSNPNLSLRQQLELHRTDQTCASCHRVMDSIGFGLENYNAIGEWRVDDQGKAIDPSGTLPGGEAFSNSMELLKILSGREEEFAKCMTEKMLTYGLGRGMEYYDRVAVEEIVSRLKIDKYKFSTLVEQIVLSRPFRLQRRDPGMTEVTSAP
jgi:mono/diheme cytochrome c family protein